MNFHYFDGDDVLFYLFVDDSIDLRCLNRKFCISGHWLISVAGKHDFPQAYGEY